MGNLHKSEYHVLSFLLIVFVAAAGYFEYGMRIDQIRYGTYENGFEMHYSVINNGQEDIENAKVTMWIPEADYYEPLAVFDLEEDQKHALYAFPDVSELKKGEYLTRIKAHSDHAEDVKWRFIEIE